MTSIQFPHKVLRQHMMIGQEVNRVTAGSGIQVLDLASYSSKHTSVNTHTWTNTNTKEQQRNIGFLLGNNVDDLKDLHNSAWACIIVSQPHTHKGATSTFSDSPCPAYSLTSLTERLAKWRGLPSRRCQDGGEVWGPLPGHQVSHLFPKLLDIGICKSGSWLASYWASRLLAVF